MPLFSIVVPAYNAEATLAETLDAAVAQTFEDWECVVVDDGSTDTTAAMVQTYQKSDPRFRLFQQENQGAAAAHNAGAKIALGEFIVVCAADDYLLPPHLHTMDRLIRDNPGCDIYSCNGEYLYDKTGAHKTVYRSHEWRRERSLSFEDVLEECFFGVGAVYRKRLLDTMEGYRSGIYSDDYDFWLRAMAKDARHCYTPQVLSVHRISDFQQTANLAKVHESNLAVYQNLITSGWVSPEQIPLVEAAVEARRRAYEAGPTLEAQAQRLQDSLERVMGRRLAETAMRVVHSVSWMVRPLRERLASKKRP
jgi:glycosyltransferase involved in cell wall biosynthesis